MKDVTGINQPVMMLMFKSLKVQDLWLKGELWDSAFWCCHVVDVRLISSVQLQESRRGFVFQSKTSKLISQQQTDWLCKCTQQHVQLQEAGRNVCLRPVI